MKRHKPVLYHALQAELARILTVTLLTAIFKTGYYISVDKNLLFFQFFQGLWQAQAMFYNFTSKTEIC